jgi:hypothetical protein
MTIISTRCPFCGCHYNALDKGPGTTCGDRLWKFNLPNVVCRGRLVAVDVAGSRPIQQTEPAKWQDSTGS